MSQLYRDPSEYTIRDKIIVLLLNICENATLLLDKSEFVVRGERVFLLPRFSKQPGMYKPANRQLFMNLAYTICFGING
jgi:hypothetical protein